MILINPLLDCANSFRCEIFSEKYCATICKSNIPELADDLYARLMTPDDEWDSNGLTEVAYIVIDISGWGRVLFCELSRRGMHLHPINAKAIHLWLPKQI